MLHTVQKLSPSADSHVHKHSSSSPYPITYYVNCDTFSMQYRAFLAAITIGVEPNSFAEAMKDDRWKDAMKRKIQVLEEKKTWTIKPLLLGKRAISCKWVYKIKYNADIMIERYKARLVILRNKQVEGIDYTKTFAPVDKITTVCTFLVVEFSKDK